jgi:hypothetical protein
MKILRTLLFVLSFAVVGCSHGEGGHHCNHEGCDCQHEHARGGGGEAPGTAAPAAATEGADAPQPTE